MNILRVSGVLQRQSLIVELAFADLDNVDFLYFSISLIGTLQFSDPAGNLHEICGIFAE